MHKRKSYNEKFTEKNIKFNFSICNNWPAILLQLKRKYTNLHVNINGPKISKIILIKLEIINS